MKAGHYISETCPQMLVQRLVLVVAVIIMLFCHLSNNHKQDVLLQPHVGMKRVVPLN